MWYPEDDSGSGDVAREAGTGIENFSQDRLLFWKKRLYDWKLEEDGYEAMREIVNACWRNIRGMSNSYFGLQGEVF